MLERVLIVGMGSIGSRHARLARDLMPDVRLAAWRHASGAATAGVAATVTSLEDALAFTPQLAVIASPASKHLEAALPLADAGVHLLVEKPISESATGVAELIATSRMRGVVLMTGYNLRFLPSMVRLRELLADRRVGRVLSVRAEAGQYLPTWRPQADYRQTVSASAALGGGVLTELSHEFDYLRWLFGEVDWVSATARRQSSLEVDVEDTAHVTMGFRPAGREPALVAALSMDFVRHDTTRTCTIIGESGTLRFDAIAGTIELFDPIAGGWTTLFAQPVQRDDTYLAEWRHLLACIEGGKRPHISGEDGLAAIAIVEAVKQSSSTGRTVRLDEMGRASSSGVFR